MSVTVDVDAETPTPTTTLPANSVASLPEIPMTPLSPVGVMPPTTAVTPTPTDHRTTVELLVVQLVVAKHLALNSLLALAPTTENVLRAAVDSTLANVPVPSSLRNVMEVVVSETQPLTTMQLVNSEASPLLPNLLLTRGELRGTTTEALVVTATPTNLRTTVELLVGQLAAANLLALSSLLALVPMTASAPLDAVDSTLANVQAPSSLRSVMVDADLAMLRPTTMPLGGSVGRLKLPPPTFLLFHS